MTAVLLDTHAWVWSLFDPDNMKPGAKTALSTAETVYVAPCSFYEIARKAALGKWPAIVPYLATLPDLLENQGGHVSPFTAEIALRAGDLSWDHRDPFDRMIAATAITLECPLISRDVAFDGLTSINGWPGRIAC